MDRRSPLFAAVAVLAFTLTPVSAISPSVVMVYGERVERPVLLRSVDSSELQAFGLLWWRAGTYANPTPIEPQLWNGLRDRPYLNPAIFWGPYNADELEPANASQHGRFYPATASEPAIVVTTLPDMQKKSNPVPSDLERFAAAWALSPQELATIKRLGFPGF